MLQSTPVLDKPQKTKRPPRWRAAGIRLLDWLRTAKRPFMLALTAFLMSFAQLFGVPSPFCCTMVAVACALGESPLFPLAGTALAMGMRLLWGIPPDVWQLAGCVILALTRRFYFGKRDWVISLWTAAALMPRVLFGFMGGSPAHQLLAMVSVAMGAVCAPAFYQAACILKEPKAQMGWDDKLCLILILTLLLCAMGYLYLFTINLGLWAACLLTLCLSFACGGGAAAVGGLLTGTALALCGHGSQPLILLAASGLTAGLTSRLESRIKTALAFCLSASLAALICASPYLLPQSLAALTACISFFFVDRVHLARLKTITQQIQPQGHCTENAYAGEMLRQWENAIEEMAESLPEVPAVPSALPWQSLRGSLCQGCDQLDSCWEVPKESLPLPQCLWQAGQEGDEALKAYAAATDCPCLRLHLVQPAIAGACVQMEADQLRTGRARLEQAMIRTHLQAMAQAVRRLSTAAQGESLSDLKGAMEIERVLKETSFPARLLYARRMGGHLQCALESETPAFTRWQPQRLISDLWAHGGLSMEITCLERGRMYLEETPVFRLQTGSATLAMEADNGDGILTMRFPGGRHLLALSDGMGHGRDAHQESQETLNLLRLCLAAGYTRPQAITAVNGMMLSATGGDRFATVDLWTIDLWSGLAQVEKLGACQSCLWRGDRLRFIEGAALPLGILEDISPQSRQVRLYDNDLLLIFSDGVADAFPSSQELAAAVSRCVYQDPQRTADALLRLALISAGGIPKDDMTVLAARVTQWSAPAGVMPFAASL